MGQRIMRRDEATCDSDTFFISCHFCDYVLDVQTVPHNADPTPGAQARGYERMAKHVRSKHMKPKS